jgi:hypothetical protein
MWVKFSLALVLAIGLAIKDGPASLMDGSAENGPCVTESISNCATNDTVDGIPIREPDPPSEHHMPNDQVYDGDSFD